MHQKLLMASTGKASGYVELSDFDIAIKQITNDLEKYKSSKIINGQQFLLLQYQKLTILNQKTML